MNLNNEIASLRVLIQQRMTDLILADAPFEKSEISQVLIPLLAFAKTIVELDLKLVQPVMAKPKRSYNPFDDDLELDDDEDDDDIDEDSELDDDEDEDEDEDEWGL